MENTDTIDGLPVFKKSAAPALATGDGLPIFKKKVEQTGGAPTAPILSGGGIPDPSFPVSTDNTTPFSPQYHQQQAQQRQAQSDQLQGAISAYGEAQGGTLPTQPQSTDQIKAYKEPTIGQKTAFELKSIAGSLNKGVANMVIAPLYHYGNKVGLVSDEERARVLNEVSDSDKETFGLDPHNLQHGDNMVHNAINQFAYMAPALITAPGTGGASFGLQTAGQAATAVQKMKDNGVEFNNHSDDLFILGSGIIGTALGRGSMGKLFSSFGSATKNNVVSALTADAIKELGEKGTQATADDITKTFLAKASTLAEKVGQTGLAGLQQYAKVGTELSAANAATFGTKKLANAISGSEPFKDTTGQDFVQGAAEPFGLDKDAHGNPLTALANMATSPAGVFGTLGAGSEALGLIGNKAPIIESLQNDNSPENISAVKQQLAQTGQAKGWDEQEITNAGKGVDLLASTVGKLPKNLSPEKMQKGVSLIMGQDELQQQLTDLQQQRSQLHPSVADVVSPQEQLLQDKIDQANDKLKDLVTGSRPTYSKGTEADGTDGHFFKTVNGVKEEIPPHRYFLEALEREVKANANKQAEPIAENGVPDAPKEIVPEKVNEEPEINIGEQNHAIQEPSAESLPLQQEAGNSEGISEGNPKGSEVIGESEPTNVGSGDAQPKAVDAVTHGIVVPENIMGRDPSARFDFGMDTRDKQKAVRDIKNGNYETEPAKKMLAKLQEWDKNDEYPIIEGLGGAAKRTKFATGEEIQNHIDEAKAGKLGELTTEQIKEVNKPLSELGFTHKDFEDYENHRTGTGNAGSTESIANDVPQPKNDNTASPTQDTGSKTPQGSEPKIADKAKELADRIRSLKSSKEVFHGGLEGVGVAVWDGALETIATTIEAGGKLADAIQEGVKHILNNHPELDAETVGKKLNDDINGVSDEPIGITREETRKQREMRGLEDLPEADRVTLSDMFDEGKKAVEEREIDPTALAIEIADKPRNLTPTEVNALLYDRQQIRQGLEDVKSLIDSKITDTDSSPESIELIQARQKFLENQLDTNERAIRSGARQNSLALNAMKSMINADYTLAEQRSRMRVAAGGELTPAMEAELEKYKAERDKAIKDLEDYQNAQKEIKLKKEIEVEKRKATKIATKESLKAERKSIVEDFRSELKKMRQSGSFNSAGKASVEFLQAAAPFMRKMLTNLVKEGIVEAKDIVAAIRDEFKDDIDGLTDRDVMDALSGKHNKKVETKNELAEQRKAIVRTLDLTAKLEDLKNRDIPEKNERRQVQKNKEIANLEEQIKEEKKKINFETAEDRSKENLRKKLDKVNERIKNNDFEPPAPRNMVKADPESITLQAKIKKAENNFDAMAERLSSHSKSKLEKTLTTIQQIRRAMLLSGTKTLAKLYSFALARSVSTPIEEAVTSLNTKIPFLSRIAKNSPRFSQGFNPKAEAEAITTRWSKATLGDSWIDVLKTGTGELDRLYGKQGVDKDFDLNPSALEFFGRLHGAFKNSTKRAEFFRSFQKRLEFAAKQGQDINDPNVQFVTGLEAYADGKRAILMNDNILVDKGYKSLLRGLEQSDKLNKNNTGKVIAAVIRGLFPIVKIPTNYVVESLDVATFGVRAIPNLIKAMSKGVDSLTPKESDMVMRTIAKGQIGLGLMIYAYANLDMFGGYYSGKRTNSDLKPGDIKMFGMVLPHFLSHNPYFEAMQIAATMRRAVDKANKSKKKDGLIAGSKNAIKGLTEQIPFTSAGEILGSHHESVGDVLGKTTKNLIEPRLLQEGAEWTDPKTSDKLKRNPKGFTEQLESGVPGLRENIPLKKKK